MRGDPRRRPYPSLHGRPRGARAALAGVIAPFAAAAVLALAGAPQPRALVVTETAGFHHPSIPAARAALQRLGEQSPDFDIVPVASSRALTAGALRRAQAVVF